MEASRPNITEHLANMELEADEAMEELHVSAFENIEVEASPGIFGEGFKHLDQVAVAFNEGHMDQLFKDYYKGIPRRVKAKRWCCSLYKRSWFGIPFSVVLSIFILLPLIILSGLIALVASIPQSIATYLFFATKGTLAQHGYMLRPLKWLHVNAQRKFLRYFNGINFWHSRFADIRVDVPMNDDLLCSVHPIPCLSDNIAYLVVDHDTRVGCVVDPADAKAIAVAVDEIGEQLFGERGSIKLEAILTTHKHWDHAGGNALMKKMFPAIEIYGHKSDHVLACTHPVIDKQIIQVGSRLIWHVIAAPCHTHGSVMYLFHGKEDRDILFTGDTLLQGACGEAFEGSFKDMPGNFATIIARCSKNTLMFPGHEYASLTVGGLMGGMSYSSLAPERFFALAASYFQIRHRRGADKLPNIPVRLDEERLVNPIFGAVEKHQKVLLDAVLSLKKMQNNQLERPEAITKSTPNLRERRTGTKTTTSYKPACVTHESSRNPFVSVYRSDFENLRRKLLNGEVDNNDAVAHLDEMLERMKIKPSKHPKKNHELNGSINDIPDAQKFDVIQAALTAITTSKMEGDDEQDIDPPGVWISKDKLLGIIEDVDEKAGELLNDHVWSEGSYAPLEHVALALLGITPKPPKNENQDNSPNVEKVPVNEPQKAKTNEDPKKPWCGMSICCCTRRDRKNKPKWDGLELPKPVHDVHSCPVCSESYLVAKRGVGDNSANQQHSNIDIHVVLENPDNN